MIDSKNSRRWIYLLTMISIISLCSYVTSNTESTLQAKEITPSSEYRGGSKLKQNSKVNFFQKKTCDRDLKHRNQHKNHTAHSEIENNSLRLFTNQQSFYCYFGNQVYRWAVLNSIEYFPRMFCFMFHIYYEFFRVMLRKKTENKLYYHVNFANNQGGSKILMESSRKLHGTSKVLEEKLDTYMYTDQRPPFSFIIGLTEEVVIEQLIVTSNQMYSRSVRDIRLQGKFTQKDPQWVLIGMYRVQAVLRPTGIQEQLKNCEVIFDQCRYLRVTIVSTYEKWTYFTLTQIQVHGKGLFADAVSNENEEKSNSNRLNSGSIHTHTCQNQFKEFVQRENEIQPRDDNLITSLLNKIQQLERRNLVQGEKISDMSKQSLNLAEMIKEHQMSRMWEFYALSTSIVLSSIAIFSLICIWLLQRGKKRIRKNNIQNEVFYENKSQKRFK